jgi:hypothetical protein
LDEVDVLQSTELDSTELDSTELDSTELESTELDSTELDSSKHMFEKFCISFSDNSTIVLIVYV